MAKFSIDGLANHWRARHWVSMREVQTASAGSGLACRWRSRCTENANWFAPLSIKGQGPASPLNNKKKNQQIVYKSNCKQIICIVGARILALNEGMVHFAPYLTPRDPWLGIVLRGSMSCVGRRPLAHQGRERCIWQCQVDPATNYKLLKMFLCI